MRIVNVVATCKKVVEMLHAPYVEVKNGRKYFIPLNFIFSEVRSQKRIIAVVFNTGRVKLFSPVYPLPNLPYFSDCKIENIVAITEIPAMPFEELLEFMERRGFIIGDREKVNAVLAYRGKTTVRIFPKTNSDTYKAVIFARSEADVEEIMRLLSTR